MIDNENGIIKKIKTHYKSRKMPEHEKWRYTAGQVIRLQKYTLRMLTRLILQHSINHQKNGWGGITTPKIQTIKNSMRLAQN